MKRAVSNMNVCTIVLLAIVTVGECLVNPGAQIRLTDKGLSYVVQVASKIMEKDLKEKSFDASGKSGHVEWQLTNLKISSATFGTTKLQPKQGVGIEGVFSGISISGGGHVHAKYKKGWIKISDGVDVSLSASNIHITVTLSLGVDTSGRPTVTLQHCNAGVDRVKLHFHGSRGWLYNLFSRYVEGKVKSHFQDMLCKVVQKEIDGDVKTELATFPVTKKIDKWAVIDYRLTTPALATSDYVDVFLKGEFKSANSPKESSLVPPKLSLSSDHNKMLYIWITDYTVNTAGEVYNAGSLLDITFSAWDKKTPEIVKSMLNTNNLKIIPQLQAKYPNRPMAVQLKSYKAPTVQIAEKKINLLLFVDAILSVKDKSEKVVEVLRIKFDMNAGANVTVKDDRIGGQILKFDYNAAVFKSSIGPVTIPLNNPFVKALLERTIISKLNPLLAHGFPLPTLKKVELLNMSIELHKNVIRLGTDIKYSP